MNSTRWAGAARALGCTLAAFSTYFCMYAFRKPFAAGQYAGLEVFGFDYKILAVLSQIAGYTLSKFVGIRVVSEMEPRRRVLAIAGLIAFAGAALLLFGLVPQPYNLAFLFLNGLPLGMVWGLVFSFIEGRRSTELLGAGLCCSFILASGVVKSVGRWLVVSQGISEFWMPALTGALFVPPLIVSLWVLSRVTPPDEGDQQARAQRPPMSAADRRAWFREHGWGIAALIGSYLLLGAYRDFRDNFAVELWAALGHADKPALLTLSEAPIALLVMGMAAGLVLIRSNRSALRLALATLGVGSALIAVATLGFVNEELNPALWMILVGLGMYLPYIAFHVAIFERLIALVRRPANVGFFMYLADALAYAGSVAILLCKNFAAPEIDWLRFFVTASFVLAGGLLILFLASLALWSRHAEPEDEVVPAVIPS